MKTIRPGAVVQRMIDADAESWLGCGTNTYVAEWLATAQKPAPGF